MESFLCFFSGNSELPLYLKLLRKENYVYPETSPLASIFFCLSLWHQIIKHSTIRINNSKPITSPAVSPGVIDLETFVPGEKKSASVLLISKQMLYIKHNYLTLVVNFIHLCSWEVAHGIAMLQNYRVVRVKDVCLSIGLFNFKSNPLSRKASSFWKKREQRTWYHNFFSFNWILFLLYRVT